MKNKDALTKEDKKMLNSIFLRSFTIFAGTPERKKLSPTTDMYRGQQQALKLK